MTTIRIYNVSETEAKHLSHGDWGRVIQPRRGKWELQQKTEVFDTFKLDRFKEKVPVTLERQVTTLVCVDPAAICKNYEDAPPHVAGFLKSGGGAMARLVSKRRRVLFTEEELGIEHETKAAQLSKAIREKEAELAAIEARLAKKADERTEEFVMAELERREAHRLASIEGKKRAEQARAADAKASKEGAG